ncbi:MAG: DUF3149 domain-containing protein [gamma proteobacterium symbiont of Bathyaustriella thionipta]|nr:DUF3149 domain-containing protein [gamma proteobacterium symbiont of Bathyaustriella thionipta]
MELFAELFSDWVGVLSFLVIAFILAMMVFFVRLIIRKSADPEA